MPAVQTRPHCSPLAAVFVSVALSSGARRSTSCSSAQRPWTAPPEATRRRPESCLARDAVRVTGDARGWPRLCDARAEVAEGHVAAATSAGTAGYQSASAALSSRARNSSCRSWPRLAALLAFGPDRTGWILAALAAVIGYLLPGLGPGAADRPAQEADPQRPGRTSWT